MTWKRWSVAVICFLLVLFACGCVPDIAAFWVIKDPGNRLIDYDPDRQIYILCENVYSDVYLGTYAGVLNFYIFTRKPVEVDSVSVTLPIENPYEVFVSDSPDCRETEITILQEGQDMGEVSANNALPYYVYQCYKGMDFAQIGQLATAELYGTGATDSETNWQDLMNAEVESFQSLTAKQLPEFYAYQVYLVIQGGTSPVEETFGSMEVTIGGAVYRKEIGQVHLIPEKIPTRVPIGALQNTVVQQFHTHTAGTTQQLYSDGIGCDEILRFTAPEDLTLTGVHILDRYTQLLDLVLTVTTKDGLANSFQWDGESPIALEQGEEASLTLYYRNPHMANLWYVAEMCVEVDYAVEDLIQCVLLRRTLYPVGINLHEAYAVIFAGLDMEPYYRGFYYPVCEPWLAAYRAEIEEG